MKYDRAHFEKEAARCVPHLSPEEREKWIDQCHAEHPGVTDASLTGDMADTFMAMEAWKGRALAAEQELLASRVSLRVILVFIGILLLVFAVVAMINIGSPHV